MNSVEFYCYLSWILEMIECMIRIIRICLIDLSFCKSNGIVCCILLRFIFFSFPSFWTMLLFPFFQQKKRDEYWYWILLFIFICSGNVPHELRDLWDLPQYVANMKFAGAGLPLGCTRWARWAYIFEWSINLFYFLQFSMREFVFFYSASNPVKICMEWFANHKLLWRGILYCVWFRFFFSSFVP